MERQEQGFLSKELLKMDLLLDRFYVVTKDEINQYAVNHQLEPRLDPSNEEDDYVRNRFRHMYYLF